MERLKESEKAEEYRIKGELLTANLYQIEKGMASVELDNWYSEDGGKIKIVLVVLYSYNTPKIIISYYSLITLVNIT